MRSAYLGGLSYELGTLRPITELPELVAFSAHLRYLHRMGLRNYARADRPLFDMLVASGKRSLAAAAVPRANIGAIVYASSSYSAEHDLELLPRLALALDIPDAVPRGVFLGNCANGPLALDNAHQLIASGRTPAVLVIIADAVPLGRVRALEDRTCVLGDGVASCVVGAHELGGYELEALEVRHQPQLVAIDRHTGAGKLAYMNTIAAGVSSLGKAIAARTHRTPADHARLVTGNYNLSIIGNHAELCGMPAARLFRDNVARISHCFAADQLIALADLHAQCAPDDRIFVLASGAFLWAAMSVRRV